MKRLCGEKENNSNTQDMKQNFSRNCVPDVLGLRAQLPVRIKVRGEDCSAGSKIVHRFHQDRPRIVATFQEKPATNVNAIVPNSVCNLHDCMRLKCVFTRFVYELTRIYNNSSEFVITHWRISTTTCHPSA